MIDPMSEQIDPTPEQIDPTPEQRSRDVAANTLVTIGRLLDDARLLRSQLEELAECMTQSDPDAAIADWLLAVQAAPGDVLRDAQEALLEIAQALPALGIDFGDEESPPVDSEDS